MSSDSIEIVESEDGGFELTGSELEVGDTVDGIYRLTNTLGQGAMGKIFEAEDELLKRRVAIKVALIEEAVQVLIAEARAMAALRHPHLPVIHAAGRHLGIDYLVMERLHGIDLDKHIGEVFDAGHSLRLSEALELLIPITDALRATHHAGIAHRDIKPENVLLCKRGPVLIDFGLVAAASADDAIDGGSPCYVAPEIIRQDSERHSRHLADIYSLGVLAFELFTGSVPYDHDDLKALLLLHVQAPIPDARARRPDLPAELAELIIEMMAKSPAERPSAEEVLWQLRAIARNAAKHEPPPQPAVLIVSEDVGLCGKLARMHQSWAPHATVAVSRTIDSALAAIQKTPPYLLVVDTSFPSGVELLMQLRGGELPEPAALVTLIPELHTADFALLRRLNAVCSVPSGESMLSELEAIGRNVLNPKQAAC